MGTPHVRSNPTNPPNPEQHIPPDEERMSPQQARAASSPLLRALAWIGLDLTGPGRASILQIIIYALLLFVPIALLVRFVFNFGGLWLFITASAAIIPLAKILGSATEELALRVGSGIG